MRYTVSVSRVSVVGHIRMPATVAAMDYTLSAHDVENIRVHVTSDLCGPEGPAPADWREGVEDWCSTHCGDFQSVDDFTASLEVDGETVDLPWASEESELTYNDCMFGDEDREGVSCDA